MMVRTQVSGGEGRCGPVPRRARPVASCYGNGTLRVTTRQGFQLHGVLKDETSEAAIRGINDVQPLETLAACGDVERNVMSCPAPLYGDSWSTPRLQATGRRS